LGRGNVRLTSTWDLATLRCLNGKVLLAFGIGVGKVAREPKTADARLTVFSDAAEARRKYSMGTSRP
jgi:hypothetical protein